MMKYSAAVCTGPGGSTEVATITSGPNQIAIYGPSAFFANFATINCNGMIETN